MNWTVLTAMAALTLVIIILALILCRITPSSSKQSIFFAKAQRADEVAVVQ